MLGNEMDRLKEIIDAISSDEQSQLAALIKAIGTADLCDSEGYSLLHWAAQYGALRCFRLLCDAGAPIDALDVDGNSPAMIAAAYGHDTMLAELIARGARILTRPDGHSALHAAAADGKIECVRQLISAIPDSINEQDNNGVGRTPLHWACQEGHTRVVEELICAGADLEAISHYEFTPLRIAASEGHIDVIRALITAGADVNRQVRCDDGSFSGSALHAAVAWQRYDVAKHLISCGADVTLADEDGRTALDHAADTKDAILIQLLRESNVKRGT